MVHDTENTNNGDSFSNMVKGLKDQVRDLKALVLLRTADSMSEWGRDLKLLEERVRNVEITFSTLKETVEKEKKFIPIAEKLKSVINQQQSEVEYINNHLPSKLPGNHLVFANVPDVRANVQIPDTIALPQIENIDPNVRQTTNQPQQTQPQKPKPKAVKYHRITYVTKDELESIPNYMKGRLTQDKINAAIDEIHSILEAKYKIVSIPMSKLSGTNLKKWKEYRDLENDQTKGLYFFTDGDMKSPTFRLDASGKALLTVLRHLSRIREVGGQLKRYVVVPPS